MNFVLNERKYKMPEGPECHSIAKSLDELISSKNITDIKILGGRYFTHKFPEGYEEFCTNMKGSPTTVKSIRVKGKLIYWIFSNNFVMLNTLGMTGSWTKKHYKHCDVCVEYGEDKKIWFRDQRHFGTIKFIPESMLGQKLETLGCDILTNEFTESHWQYLCGRYSDKTLPALIMNQKRISGIGNYLKCEILYEAKISPFRKISEISTEDLMKVYKCIKVIPRASLKAKGVSIRDYNLPDGSDGNYQFALKVYNKKKDSLGNKVKKSQTEDKRTTHWVPAVQV